MGSRSLLSATIMLLVCAVVLFISEGSSPLAITLLVCAVVPLILRCALVLMSGREGEESELCSGDPYGPKTIFL